jgi:hypothetical protein
MPPFAATEIRPRNWLADGYSSSCSSVATRNSKGTMPKSLQIIEEKNEIFLVDHLDDITDDEVDKIWYNPDEYAEIKSAYQMTVFMMESGEKMDPEEHSSRGLEYRTQDGAWARYENKRDACNAVLDEQDRQWQAEADDYEELSRTYLEHSTKCGKAAADRGKKDEKEAYIILKNSILPKKSRRNLKKVED